jgi:hypothetical protein
MAAKTYPVACGCGNVLQVLLAAAGTTVPCGCGKAIEIPSLARLKSATGESVVSADFELERLSTAGRLPLEVDCVECFRRTEHEVRIVAECERKEEAREGMTAQKLVTAWLFGLIGMIVLLLLWRPRRPERGRDLILELPIRMCESCSDRLNSITKMRDALRQSPLYARLLDKYPQTRLSVRRRSS